MDVVADWVRITGATGALLARSRMKPPWGMALPSGDHAMFHLMLEGTGWLRVNVSPVRQYWSRRAR